MTPKETIVKMLSELQSGNNWVEVDFKHTLEKADYEKTLKKLYHGGNSVWMLISHITYWRLSVANRLSHGMDIAPGIPDFYVPEEASESDWKNTLNLFDESFHTLKHAVEDFPEEKLNDPSPKGQFTYLELVHGQIQHEYYHLGQINLLVRSFSG